MLAGKLALITGGGNGIGRATAQLFAAHGASVIVADVQKESARASKESLTIAEDQQNQNQRHSFYHVDVSGANFVEQLRDAISNEYEGRAPEILINNAGVTMDRRLHDLDEHAWDWVLDINLKGTFLMTKIFSKAMLDVGVKSGSIVNISSIIGKVGNIGQVNYAASKSGVIGLTKSVARELAARNIRCNAVLPGFITTDMTGRLKPKITELVRQQIPMLRFGDPKEVAQACLYFGSDLSSYVTGTTLEVTGGLFM